MRTYNNSIVVQFDTVDSGNSGAGKLVTVFDTGTTNKAALFDATAVPIDNPVQADEAGNYKFDIADGVYDIYIDYGLPTQTSMLNELISDVGTLALINDLSQAYEFATVSEYQAFSTGFPDGKIINLLDRRASFVKISGTGTANTFNIIQSNQVSESIVLTNNGVFSADQYGAVAETGAPVLDNSAVMTKVFADAKANNAPVLLNTDGTYQSIEDFAQNKTIGKGAMSVTGFNRNYPATDITLLRATQNLMKPLMIKSASDNGEHQQSSGGSYSAFCGGAMYRGNEVYCCREATGHLATDGKISLYTRDGNGIHGQRLTDSNEVIVTYNGDVRDPHLTPARLNNGVLALTVAIKVGEGQFENTFYRLNSQLKVVSEEVMQGIPSDHFVWGNMPQTPSGRWLTCAYDINEPEDVYLWRASGSGNNPGTFLLANGGNPLFTGGGNEATLTFWGDKLVAITRVSGGQSAGQEMQMRYTYDLEGLTGWTDVVSLPFFGAAPSVTPYIPFGEPLILHASVTNQAFGYREPAINATFNLIDWTTQLSGELFNYSGSGAYGALVKTMSGYSMMWYEEVGATEGITRLWLADIDVNRFVFSNYQQEVARNNLPNDYNQQFVLLPSARPCIGNPAAITQLGASSGNQSYVNVRFKRPITIDAFATIVKVSDTETLRVDVYEDDVLIDSGQDQVKEVVDGAHVAELLFSSPITINPASTYKFLIVGDTAVYIRLSAYQETQNGYDAGEYIVIETRLGSSDLFSANIISHGFRPSI